MIRRDLIAPQVRRGGDNGTLPITFTVPAGQVIRIKNILTTEDITAGQLLTIAIDSKVMFWVAGSTTWGLGNILATRMTIETLREWGYKIDNFQIIADEGQVITISSGDNTGTFWMDYEVWGSREKYNRESYGGTDGQKRMIISCGRQVTSVAAGATSDIQLVTSLNAPGNTTFPWAVVAPPQRRYKIIALIINDTDTVGTNLTQNGVRLLHEGRELITPSGVIVTPGRILHHTFAGASRVIKLDEPYEVNSFEAVQLFLRVTSTDVGAQNATLEAGLLMEEELLEG